ncbi:MAG: hypothetical protein ABI266_03315 [Ginsengibacter sp.]
MDDIVYVEMDVLNKTLKTDEVVGPVEAVKTVSDLFLPDAGTVFEVNSILESEPEKVKIGPYGDGWMVKVKVDNVDDVNPYECCCL